MPLEYIAPAGAGAPGHAIARPRLDALLAAAVQKPLVVVQGGAGFGKSVGVYGYLSQTHLRTVWLTFTALDNQPARFWENLTATFALHRPALAESLRLLGFPETQQAFDTFLAELTGELYQDDLTVIFVFDDLYLIDEPLVKGFLEDFISAGLENSCIMLLTRQWPVFGQAPGVPTQFIGTDELRFTLEEAKALFEAAGVTVSKQEAADIHRYVSGWPIALSLVALAHQHGDAGAAGPSFLSATKPRLFTLFEREIFSQYTPAEQSLLIQLSALESFPRGLVRAVSGEAERDLGQLMRDNIYIQYDATARRFFFHPLYHEFLREKLESANHAELAETYEKAAAWCRENGHYYDAVNYYRQSGNAEALWETLLLFDASRHSQPEAEFIVNQIDALSEDFRHSHPMTSILKSVLLVNNLRFAEALGVLDGVQKQLEAGGEAARPLLGECYTARGIVIFGMEQNGFEIWFKKAAELLPNGSARWGAGLRLVDLGPGINLQSAKAGELKKSLACFTAGVPHMVQVLHGAGQGLDKLCECEVRFLQGDLKEALEPAYQALYAAEAAAQLDIVGNALFMLLRIYTATGDYQNILDTMEHVGRYEKDERAANLGIWDITRGWFYTEVDAVDQVAGWIRNAVQHGFAPISIDRAILVRLRCLIAAGRYPEALALQGQFEVLAKSKQAVITQLYAEITRAVTHNYMGNYGDAIRSLKAAYNLARGNKMFMPFIEYGNRTRSLLERARSTPGHGIPADWLEQTHTRASTYAKHHAYLAGRYRQSRQGQTPNFGLSRREVELLDNLGQGLTREEIAEGMGLSVNTVKSMLKQVFSKLGAINSADAIRIAVVNKII